MSAESVFVEDVEEDLFNFDELLVGTRKAEAAPSPPGQPAAPLSAASAPQARAASTLGVEPAAPPAAAPAAVSGAQARRELPAAAPPVATPAALAELPAGVPLVVAAPAGPSTQGLLLIALVALLNLAFVALCWRSLDAVQTLVLERGRRDAPASAPGDLAPQPQAGPAAGAAQLAGTPVELDPGSARAASDGSAALDLARQALEEGRFELARQRLFGLLAVADRFEPVVRGDLEARASFLVAEAWRREAEAAARAEAKAAGALRAVQIDASTPVATEEAR